MAKMRFRNNRLIPILTPKERQDLRRAKGVCFLCGKPRAAGSTAMCARHLELQRQAYRRRYARHLDPKRIAREQAREAKYQAIVRAKRLAKVRRRRLTKARKRVREAQSRVTKALRRR